MAVQWSSYDGGVRVGIDYVVTINTGSNDVEWRWYYGSNQSFSDAQTLHIAATSLSSYTDNFTNNQSAGDTSRLDTDVVTGYSLGKSVTATVSLSGAFTGGNPSKSITFTLPDVPDLTFPPVIAARYTTGIDITWKPGTHTNGSDVSWYQVQTSSNAAFTAIVDDIQMTHVGAQTATQSYSVTGLTPNQTYYVRVRAENDSGWSGYSGVTTTSTLAALPGTPGTPSMSAITQTGATATITAAAANGSAIDNYQYQIDTSPGFTAPATTTVNALTNAFTGKTAGTTYYVRVRAHNAFGYGAYTATTTFTTSPGLPDNPVIASAPSIGSTTLTVAWASVNGHGATATYSVQLATNAGFTTGLVTHSGLSSNSTAFTGLVAGTAYHTRIKATNTAGDNAGGYSADFPVTTTLAPDFNDPAFGTNIVDQVNSLALAVAHQFATVKGVTDAEATARATVASNLATVTGNLAALTTLVGTPVATATATAVSPHTVSGGVNALTKINSKLVALTLRIAVGAAITVNATTGLTTNTNLATLPAGYFNGSGTIAWHGFLGTGLGVPCSGTINSGTGVVDIRWISPGNGTTISTSNVIFIDAVYRIP